MKLADYQRALARAVRFRETPEELSRGVLGAGSLSPDSAIDVYRTMYWYRLVDALFDLLPRTAYLLGKRRFTELVCSALADSPSTFFALERLAAPVSRFLAAHPKTPPLTADVTRIEAAFVEALLSPNAEAPLLSRAHVSDPSFAARVARVHPSVRHVTVAPEALAIFVADPAEPEVDGADKGEPPSRAVHVVLSRPSMRVLSLVIDDAERELLQRDDVPIVSLIQTLAGPDGVPERAFSRLATWMSHGLLTLTEIPS
ncbi:MAG: putative DNA-binding domain-containing protein [Myxococcales bacterium]|nr:putative DNA-binding domain-containing protein [Myxococcales bacterium]